jgi:uncharacterized protein YjbI with pentapeptide repeats
MRFEPYAARRHFRRNTEIPPFGDARQVSLRGCILTGLRAEHLDLRCADLRGAALAYASLRWLNARHARACKLYAERADFTGADFTGADLRGANLYETTLRGARLDGADLRGIVWGSTSLAGVSLVGANLSARGRWYSFPVSAERAPYGARLVTPSRAPWRRSSTIREVVALPPAGFYDVPALPMDWRGSDARGAYLQFADLSARDVRGAILAGADLTGANLSGADLRGADLRGATLHGADLTGADDTGARTEGARWTLARVRVPEISADGVCAFERTRYLSIPPGSPLRAPVPPPIVRPPSEPLALALRALALHFREDPHLQRMEAALREETTKPL